MICALKGYQIIHKINEETNKHGVILQKNSNTRIKKGIIKNYIKKGEDCTVLYDTNFAIDIPDEKDLLVIKEEFILAYYDNMSEEE